MGNLCVDRYNILNVPTVQQCRYDADLSHRVGNVRDKVSCRCPNDSVIDRVYVRGMDDSELDAFNTIYNQYIDTEPKSFSGVPSK